MWPTQLLPGCCPAPLLAVGAAAARRETVAASRRSFIPAALGLNCPQLGCQSYLYLANAGFNFTRGALVVGSLTSLTLCFLYPTPTTFSWTQRWNFNLLVPRAGKYAFLKFILRITLGLSFSIRIIHKNMMRAFRLTTARRSLLHTTKLFLVILWYLQCKMN